MIEMYTPPADMDPLERAYGYPYFIPDHSYLFQNGQWEKAEFEPEALADRLPVLACGSNRSPEQLARKYADFETASIPVQVATLANFDVVYAAHITGYGSIAANLQPVKDVVCDVSITWLSERLLDRMHATEGLGYHYDFVKLDGLELKIGDVVQNQAYSYVYRRGSLNDGGLPIGLSEIGARGRRHRSKTQIEVWDLVHKRLGAAGTVDDYIHETVADKALRQSREGQLQKDALPFSWPKMTPVA